MDDHNKENLSSERGSTFNNKGDSSSYMSEAEQLIATGKALQMLASPNELNESKNTVLINLLMFKFSSISKPTSRYHRVLGIIWLFGENNYIKEEHTI